MRRCASSMHERMCSSYSEYVIGLGFTMAVTIPSRRGPPGKGSPSVAQGVPVGPREPSVCMFEIRRSVSVGESVECEPQMGQ